MSRQTPEGPTHRVAAIVLVALLLSACPSSRPPAPPRGSSTERERPLRGGTLRVLLVGDVDTLDPHASARPSSWFFARALHRGLLAYPAAPLPDGARAVADLAVAVPRVRGGRAVFELRDDVRFSTGARITPGDVVASLNRLRRTRRGIAPYLPDLRARALRGNRVEVRSARARTDLLWLLAHPQAAIVPAGTPRWGTVGSHPVGAGPYRLATYRAQRRIVLRRQPHWTLTSDPVRGGYVDTVEATIVTSRSRAEAAIEAGDADLLADPGPPDVSLPAVPARARSMVGASACVRYLFMRPGSEPFDDPRLRRAVAASVLRAELPGVGRVSPRAFRVLPPTVTGHAAEPVIGESVGVARAALRAARSPRGFSTTLVVADARRDRAEARAIRSALLRAGIRIRIRTVPPSLLHPNFYAARGAAVPMGIATWCADWPGNAGRGVLGALVGSAARAATAYSGVRSRRLDRVIARAADAGEQDAAAAWRRADEAVTRAAVIVPLAYPNEVNVVSERLRGWTAAPMFPRGDPATLWVAG